MIGIFTLIVLYSIFFYKQHSVKIALHLPSPFKNFWSQLKDPTHFGLFTMKEEEFDKPEVKQAIEDLAEGKKTKAVEEFLKKYEITPKNQTEQSINNQNSEAMAKKNQTQQPVVEANDQQQNNQYRYNESMINWDQLKMINLIVYSKAEILLCQLRSI